MTHSMPHYDVVLSLAIVAIARKVIILDIKETSSLSLVGIASIILALTVRHYFMKKTENGHSRPDELSETKQVKQHNHGAQGPPADTGAPDA